MDAVTKAIEMKENAIKFYQDAAGKCDHPAGKQMFLVILEDEKHHLESLRQMVNDMHIDMKQLTPIDSIKTSLETLQDKMRAKTACSLDEMEVFKMAMDMEKEFVEFYQTLILISMIPGTGLCGKITVLLKDDHEKLHLIIYLLYTHCAVALRKYGGIRTSYSPDSLSCLPRRLIPNFISL